MPFTVALKCARICLLFSVFRRHVWIFLGRLPFLVLLLLQQTPLLDTHEDDDDESRAATAAAKSRPESCEGRNCSPLLRCRLHTHTSRGLQQRGKPKISFVRSLYASHCRPVQNDGSFVFGRFSFCPCRLRLSLEHHSSINNSPLGRFLPDVRTKDCVTLKLRTVKSSIIARSPVAVRAFSTPGSARRKKMIDCRPRDKLRRKNPLRYKLQFYL